VTAIGYVDGEFVVCCSEKNNDTYTGYWIQVDYTETCKLTTKDTCNECSGDSEMSHIDIPDLEGAESEFAATIIFIYIACVCCVILAFAGVVWMIVICVRKPKIHYIKTGNIK